MITSFLVPRFEHADHALLARRLLVLTAAMAFGVLVFGLAGGFAVAVGAYMVARLARRLIEPLFMTWLNRNIEDSSVRATVISMASQSGAVGEVAGGPAIGAVGTVTSIRVALAGSAAALTPALALYGRALRHGGKEPELDRLPEVASAPDPV